MVFRYSLSHTAPQFADGMILSEMAFVTFVSYEPNAVQPSCPEVLRSLVRPELPTGHAGCLRQPIGHNDILTSVTESAVKEPNLMRLVLQASVAALVNVQSVEAVEAEMKRRAVKGN